MILVDGSVLSEPTKPAPSVQVIDWLRAHERELVIDPIILVELRFGIELLARGKRRTRLEAWFDGGVARMRCLAWDAVTGRRWAKLLADLRARGRTMPVKDSMIAASALTHDIKLATRNVKDFAATHVALVNPF
jgi:predicted nucleic acid-binding protein